MQTHHELGDILANAITHGIGAVLAIAGAASDCRIDARHRAACVVSCTVFAATLVLVYVCSTLYHSLVRTRARHVFHILDHSAIYLLIAGTYTPFHPGSLARAAGLDTFGWSGRWLSQGWSSRASPLAASPWRRRWFTWLRAGSSWSQRGR